MDQLIYLIPIAIFLGLLGLAAFIWSLRSGQFDDLEGAAYRILFEEDGDDAADDENDAAEANEARKAQNNPGQQ